MYQPFALPVPAPCPLLVVPWLLVLLAMALLVFLLLASRRWGVVSEVSESSDDRRSSRYAWLWCGWLLMLAVVVLVEVRIWMSFGFEAYRSAPEKTYLWCLRVLVWCAHTVRIGLDAWRC